MLTDTDLQKIKTLLKANTDKLAQELKTQLQAQKEELKEYIHQSADAVIAGVDNLMEEHKFEPRLKGLEKIHPEGKHVFTI